VKKEDEEEEEEDEEDVEEMGIDPDTTVTDNN